MPDGNDTNRRLQGEIRMLREKVASLEALIAQSHTSGDEGSMGEVARERERLIDIIESTTDFVSTSTPDGRILFLNRAGRRLVGLPDDTDVGGMHIHDFHPPRATKFILEVGIPKCIADGSFSHETYLLHRNGTEIPVSQVILSHKLSTGDVGYLSTIIRDISEELRIAGALVESERKFGTVIQASPMGVHMYELESDGRLVFVGANPAADALLGVDNAQFIGKTVEEAFPPMADTEIPERYRRAASEGTPWRTSQVNYEDEQITGAFEVQAFQTSPNRMAAMFLDITNRLRAEEALRESEQRYRELFESMAQGVVYQDAGGRIVMVNPAAERILGLSEDEMTGRTSLDPRWKTIREDRSEFPGHDHPAMVSLRTGRPANTVMAVFNVAEETPRFHRELTPVEAHSLSLFGKSVVYTHSGQKSTNKNPVEYAKEMEAMGVGEILLTSIDRDGTWTGFDIDLIQRVSSAVDIPVIACGGAGSVEDLGRAATDGGASAVAAGSMVVYQSQGLGVLINFPRRAELEKVLP